MPPLKWAAFVLGAAAILSYVIWWYRTREEPVGGRAVAAGFRASALVLILLIILNPKLPAGWQVTGDDAVQLLDASFSMSRPVSPSGPPTWRLALDSLAGAGDVWLFGGPMSYRVPGDSLPPAPVAFESRLAPAVRAIGLAGARRAEIYTDGRIDDAPEALREARRQGLSLSFITISSRYPEAGVAAVSAPVWVQAGDSAVVTVELVAARAAGDTLQVEIVDEADRVVARTRVPAPDAGRFATARFAFTAPDAAATHRYVVRLDGGDPVPRDDQRPFYLQVSESPGGPVLISLIPDWEPSFLVPSLNRLTDMPGAAYLWLADSLVDLDSHRTTSIAAVQRRAREAPLLVLHGYGAGAPAWARELARRARRLLVFTAGERGFELPGWGITVGPPAAGEWYASPEVPRTPIAVDLVGFAEAELPPLLRPREVEARGGWAPLDLRHGRRGEPVRALVAGRDGDRRWAVATAEGYWRWAFRPGDGRQLYRTLWTGLAGWLLEDGTTAGGAALDPLERVAERGRPLRWLVPSAADSLAVELSRLDSETVRRAAGAGGDTLELTTPPGRYLYRSTVFRGGEAIASGSGPAEVESFSSELLPRPVDELEAPGAGADAPVRVAGRTRRLATVGWSYLLLIVLFCAEWAVRRFIGLR
ncbi:MAG: hypothetical protein GWN99_17055 [Gemmatimonadetes bacterium]|uniref:Glutamine amidotransferase domain-containing protein n=1 Tax=Candidatus Kutchimonas denitrificans TaxID=3056748 RepID=A0AAE4Z9C6_9BACT|nr:hypothetical protein [Gemmatimonadota bacterium]NIR74556.1 hypothetical protein [Candidatus Kutchimonas denitrificans]NIS02746.1 hypothetical protein [Gemmatimonadota bacterium]NIT68907.1 hypothetical protein [Gemmatimonadota bacterium]NIU52212.1 hypothetical protein [Gemmatimonadota bacterium]